MPLVSHRHHEYLRVFERKACSYYRLLVCTFTDLWSFPIHNPKRLLLIRGGIGRATAFALANHGCSIAVHYHSAKAKADEIVAELKKIQSVNAVAFQADLSDYDNARKLHTNVVAQMGDVDILFNNSGVTNTVIGPHGNIQDISVEEFESTWKTNTGSSYLV